MRPPGDYPGPALTPDALPDESPFLKLEPPQRRPAHPGGAQASAAARKPVNRCGLVFEICTGRYETQVLLDSLIESLPTARLLTPGQLPAGVSARLGSKTSYTQLRLDPLPQPVLTNSCRPCWGRLQSSTAQTAAIARTEGNPFFLEESVRTLVETGALVGASGAYRLAQALPTIQVPATVRAVLAARIDRLPPEEKRLAPDRGGHRHGGAFPYYRPLLRCPRMSYTGSGPPASGGVALRDGLFPRARVHFQTRF